MQNSAWPKLTFPLAVAAHDAGSANLIIGWLLGRHDLEIRLCLAGPAESLWTAAFGKPEILSPAEALQDAVALLSGTSYVSDLEHQARKLANANGIHSIGVVDHWVNYHDRFLRAGCQVLPDEIWVADEQALSIALDCFPGTAVQLQPNLYLADQVSQVLAAGSELNSDSARHVLYALEPVRHHWAADGPPGEFQALDYFIRNGWRLGLDETTEIRLRPHPSDPQGKYDAWLDRHPAWNIRIDQAASLAKSIAWSDTVVGCETYAMVVGLAAGRCVVSSLPPHATRCRLPQKAIIHLSDLQR
jgi:hypothetical protein